MAKLQAVRGMHDILPIESANWQYLEKMIAEVLEGFAYKEIRFPIVESTELFKRSIGEVTDIVEKEMYSFEDRNGDSLTLRPEGTAGCVRAAEQGGLLYNQIQKLWYTGPMFRHERPQKGRQRQFHQIGLECFGLNGPDIDAELIVLTAQLWRKLGLQDDVVLELNSIGSAQSRQEYRQALLSYLTPFKAQLDEDSQRRMSTNPLRILDSKSEQTQAIIVNAPKLSDFLDEDSREHFSKLCQILDQCGIKYTINEALVRGLDYYGKTVFEWTTDKLGAQATICAGGRYDGLVEQLGGKPTPAVGCAMGVERLLLLLETLNKLPRSNSPLVYVVVPNANNYALALELSCQWRDQLSGAVVVLHHGGGNFKSQMKRADKSGALFAVIFDEKTLLSDQVIIKNLRDFDVQQQLVEFAAVSEFLNEQR